MAAKKETKKAAAKKPVGGKRDAKLIGFGHREGSASAKIDMALMKGATKDALIKIGGSWKRVYSHIRHLKPDHGVEIIEKGGVYSAKGGKGANDKAPKPKMPPVSPEIKKTDKETKAKEPVCALPSPDPKEKFAKGKIVKQTLMV